jgi:LPXTG-site transpeptidase (sortase) family protein
MAVLTKTYVIKRIAAALSVAAAVFLLLNSSYILQNLKFYFHSAPSSNNRLEETTNKAQPDHLWIDSLNIEAPLKYVSETKESVYQAALKDGVVHFPGTALPGQVGNAYYFGHSSDYPWSGGHYKTVFALLPKIQTGAVIKITDSGGNLFTYTVTGTKIVVPSDTSVLSQETSGKKLLSVQTSYPVGTALRRFVVVAELR